MKEVGLADFIIAHDVGTSSDKAVLVDFEGHAEDPPVALALDCLRLKLREVKVLGSYPLAES